MMAVSDSSKPTLCWVALAATLVVLYGVASTAKAAAMEPTLASTIAEVIALGARGELPYEEEGVKALAVVADGDDAYTVRVSDGEGIDGGGS